MPPCKYRVYEDTIEPAYLQLFNESLTITYEHKSIIYIHEWKNIVEFKPIKLQKLNGPPNPKDLKHNLFQVYIDVSPQTNGNNEEGQKLKKKNTKKQIVCKLFRFDSRNNLDEFLTEAIRNGFIDRIVEKGWFSSKILYLPCVIKSNNNQDETEQNVNNSNSSDALKVESSGNK